MLLIISVFLIFLAHRKHLFRSFTEFFCILGTQLFSMDHINKCCYGRHIIFLVFFSNTGVFSDRPPPPWNSPPFNGKLTHSPRMKRSSQCYGDLGCFSNAFPFNNTGEALPLSPRFIRTRFFLFSSINERFPIRLVRNDVEKLRRSRYNGNLPTIVIIHGFQQHGLVNWTKQIAREFILKVRYWKFINN